jgi:hypothetical protein
VANDSPNTLALPPAFGPLIRVSHLVMPLPVEVVVQRRQRDIGERRRENSALRGPGQCLFPVSEFGEDPGFQERLNQGTALNPPRRERTCPRAVKRARHNSYRVKKPGEPASTRHDGPGTIRLHVLNPRAA